MKIIIILDIIKKIINQKVIILIIVMETMIDL